MTRIVGRERMRTPRDDTFPDVLLFLASWREAYTPCVFVPVARLFGREYRTVRLTGKGLRSSERRWGRIGGPRLFREKRGGAYSFAAYLNPLPTDHVLYVGPHKTTLYASGMRAVEQAHALRSLRENQDFDV